MEKIDRGIFTISKDREYEIQINKRRKRMDQYLITRIVSRKIEHAKLITGVCTS